MASDGVTLKKLLPYTLVECTTSRREDSYYEVSWVASDGVTLEILLPHTLVKYTIGTRKDSYCQVSWVALDGVTLEILLLYTFQFSLGRCMRQMHFL